MSRTGISPISQALFLSDGRELEVNEETLEVLGVKPGDIVRYWEVPEVEEEEIFMGFEGTGLIGNGF